MPLNRMFIFSGNNTGTGILQNIIDSGGVGIICETEADMVSNSIASDYGHWSEVIRCSSITTRSVTTGGQTGSIGSCRTPTCRY